ncbi:MAG TPA: N-acetylneuraminate synthase family protein [Microvirga sp.]|jgi:N-acetylneuraminate synthase|nr:N-acetylneuraminate synthase family protein [Microvirga sp.]
MLHAGRCLIIAEVAQAHDGSLGAAHAFIDAIADAGADAVKFQTHIADAESGPEEPFRVNFSKQDRTRYEYWKRLEFRPDEWAGLVSHARDRQLIFLSSAFSLEAVDLLESLGMPAYKVASGEVTNALLIDRMARTGKPLLLSSGMSDVAEIDWAFQRIRRSGNEIAILQCTTAYPCPPERIGLDMLQVFRSRYGCPVGLSDHSGTIYPGLAGVALGMELLELHVTFSKKMFGPDVPASVTFDELETLVTGVRFIERMRAAPADKDREKGGSEALRQMFGQALVARRDLEVGEVLTEADLATRKPCIGIAARRYDEVLGKRITRPIAARAFLKEDDIAW